MNLNNFKKNKIIKVQIYPSIDLGIIEDIESYFNQFDEKPSYSKIVNDLLKSFIKKLKENENEINKPKQKEDGDIRNQQKV